MKKNYPIRTRFAKEIVAEVMFPKRQSGNVVILCSGVPSLPGKSEILHFLADRGYVVIALRYRGTWESGGSFLKKSPARDITDVIHDISKKKRILDLYNQKELHIRVKKCIVIGASFGGPAALAVSSLAAVDKVVLLSPVIDWSAEGEDEPFAFWTRFTVRAFGDAYRVRKMTDWNKLLSSRFYNPLSMVHHIDVKKIFLIHCMDDTIVPVEPSRDFAQRLGMAYYLKAKGGHLGIRSLSHAFYWKKIAKFLKKND